MTRHLTAFCFSFFSLLFAFNATWGHFRLSAIAVASIMLYAFIISYITVIRIGFKNLILPAVGMLIGIGLVILIDPLLFPQSFISRQYFSLRYIFPLSFCITWLISVVSPLMLVHSFVKNTRWYNQLFYATSPLIAKQSK